MLADEEYGVEVLKVHEIIRMPTITKMPDIACTTIGIVSLASRDILFVLSGLVLMMLGIRMMAISLDRIYKEAFIDIPLQ